MGFLRLSRLPRQGLAANLRTILNVGFPSGGGNEYRFIDHFQIAEQYGPGGGSGGAGWLSPNDTFMQSIGSDGWPNIPIANTDNKAWGGGVRIPASWQYGAVGSGKYWILKWSGIGEVFLPLNLGAFTYQSGLSTNVDHVGGNNRFKNLSGADATVVLSYTGPAQLFACLFLASDPSNTGNPIRNFKFYRSEDEADLLAGKMYRQAYKQSLVDFNPSALRFMDWVGGNNSRMTRAEYRTLPNYPSLGGGNAGSNWVASPPYGETSGTNQCTLSSVTGTPVAMTHGEVATFRVGSSHVRTGSKTVTAITKANPGVVTSTAHGFNTGDIIAHQISSGMTELDLQPCTITVSDADHYSIGINTTSYTTFTSGTATQFTTLNVGSRGAYPIVFPSVSTFASHYGTGYWSAGDYKTCVFDKSVALQKDSAGDYVYGVWIFNSDGVNNGHAGGAPWEWCAALVNEVNAMGPISPVGAYMNIGHMGLSSMDEDHTTGSNLGIQIANVMRNGANGYDGIGTSVPLFIEYSNETWNQGGDGTSQTYYCARRGVLRWPSSGGANYGTMHALRSTIAMEDIRASAYYDSNIHFVMAGQGTVGVSSLNAVRIDGDSDYLNDPLNTWGPSSKPMDHHDHFAFAAYFEPTTSFDTTNLDNFAASWAANHGDHVAQAADIADYIEALVDPLVGGDETCDRYGDTLLPAYGTKMATFGATVMMYEGGWNPLVENITGGGRGHGADIMCFADGAFNATSTVTGVDTTYVSNVNAALGTGIVCIYGYGIPEDTTVISASGSTLVLSNAVTITETWGQFLCFNERNAYLRAVKRSPAWADALVTFQNKFGTNSEYPSDYVQQDLRFGHNHPNSYGFGIVEWGDMSIPWLALGARNRGE